MLIRPINRSTNASARRCCFVRESPGSAIPANASNIRSTDAASNDDKHAFRKLTPSRSGRTDTNRSSNDRRIRSSVSSGSTRATNRFNHRRNNSGVFTTATGTTNAFNSRFESSRTNRNKAWLMCTALASLMSPAIHASHTSGASACNRPALATTRCTECRVAVTANPISIAANSPGLYRGSPPEDSNPANRCRSARLRESANSTINCARRACAFDNDRSAAFNDSTSMAC